MKKEILVVFAFAILLIGVTFVYATMTATSPNTGTKVNYDVELRLEKGWNLVIGTPVWGKDSTISSDSEIQIEDLGASYYYSRDENKYLQIYPDSAEMDNYLTEAQTNSNEILYFSQSPVLIYSDKSGTIKYVRKDLPNVINPPLSAGWNFVTIVPGAIGKSLNQLKGDCSLDKVYFWNAGAQGWFEFSLSEIISSEYAGSGLITKVSSNCQLNLGSSGSGVNPPQVPQ